MKNLLRKTLILTTMMLLTKVSYAETRWVSDSLQLPLRSGKGNEFRILNKGLNSGTQLTVLSEDGEWTEVETNRGVQGWVRSQYLLKSPTAAIRLGAAETQLKKYKTENSKLKKQLGSTQSTGSELSKSLSDAQAQVNRLSKELDDIKSVSAGAIELNKRHQTLTGEHQMLLTDLDVLTAANEQLESSSDHTFFLYGVGAVLLGVLITLLTPLLRRRKRHSEWG